MLAVSADLKELKGARAVFAQQIRRDSSEGPVLAEGTAVVACCDAANGKARRWPKEFVEGMNR